MLLQTKTKILLRQCGIGLEALPRILKRRPFVILRSMGVRCGERLLILQSVIFGKFIKTKSSRPLKSDAKQILDGLRCNKVSKLTSRELIYSFKIFFSFLLLFACIFRVMERVIKQFLQQRLFEGKLNTVCVSSSSFKKVLVE